MANHRKTNEKFLEELKAINPTIVPLEKYETARKKINCKCSVCGNVWSVAPRHLIDGQQCPICSRINANKKLFTISKEEFLLFLENKQISLIGEYKGFSKSTNFKCDICGYEFTTRPNYIFVNNTGCRKCLHESLKLTHDEFVSRIPNILPTIKILSKYNGEKNRVKYQCNICGKIHDAYGHNLIRGYGCPICRMSKGEKKCKDFFDNNNVLYEIQYKFDNLFGIHGGYLRFDFGILNKEHRLLCLIEYDGIFHYKKQYDDDGFKTIQVHDKIKDNYCKNNNIPLLRIPYWEYENIEQILSDFLQSIYS